MTFQESIKTCWEKGADFKGRSSRSEYWWFFLAVVLTNIVLAVVLSLFGKMGQTIQSGLNLGLTAMLIFVGIRRLHDTGRSGWWWLLNLLPLLGNLVFIYFAVQESQPESNQYGPPPV